MRNVAVYYRVSTERQDIASQKNAVKRWFEEQKTQPNKILSFRDEGISGKTLKRPAFEKMLAAAYAGKIDTIVVYRLDRFSRHATTAIRLILNLDDAGVAFVSVTQPVLNLGHENPFRRTMLAAFAEIAELERETIVNRVVAGLDAARARGVTLGAPKKITPQVQAQAQKLREQGHSLRAIAKELSISLGSVSKVLSASD